MANNNRSGSGVFGKLIHSQIIIPLAALLLLIIFNLIFDPSFFVITPKTNSAGNPVLS